MKLAVPLTDRIARLAQSFVELKERVRDAVATEMGKVVADTVRDWITFALRPRRESDRPGGYDHPPRDGSVWEDPHDEWREYEPFDAPQEITTELPGKTSRWATALTLGTMAARWLMVRRLPVVPAIGLGMFAGAFALVGGPLVQAAVTAATAALDLTRIARTESNNFL